MDMILNGEMRRKANHKMTVSVNGRWFCVQISQISEFDKSFCGFWITSTLLTSCHLAFTVFGYFWIRISAVRESSTSCFIDWHENNNGKLGFEQCVDPIYSSVDKRMVTFLFVILMFRALQLLFYIRQRFVVVFVGKVKPTQCYFRFNAIYRTNKLTCETDELLVTGME